MNSDIENKAIKWRPADWNRIGNDAVDAVDAVDASVAVERAVEFRVNGKNYAMLHCTPDHLEELAAGFLLGQGLVSPMAAITLCKPVAGGSAVDIEVHGKLDSNINGGGAVSGTRRGLHRIK